RSTSSRTSGRISFSTDTSITFLGKHVFSKWLLRRTSGTEHQKPRPSKGRGFPAVPPLLKAHRLSTLSDNGILPSHFSSSRNAKAPGCNSRDGAHWFAATTSSLKD